MTAIETFMNQDVDRSSALMERYAQGEDAVFHELYNLMSPRLYRFCLRLGGGRKQDADDVFQETFLRLHRARATYQSGTRPLHWAFAIARSIHLDRLRYRRRRPEELGSEQDAAEDHSTAADDRYNPEADVRADHLAEVVTLELQKMSEKNRTAYILLREEELSVQEAADVLGTTPTVVKQRAHRAYEQLRGAIGAAGWQPRPAASGPIHGQVHYVLCEP